MAEGITERPEAPVDPRELWKRRALVWGGGTVALLILCELIAQLLVGGGPAPNEQARIRRLDAMKVGTVARASETDPAKPESRAVIASYRAGLELVGLDEVDQVLTGDDRYRAPDGGTLIAFTLGDGPCEKKPCEGWRSLAPQVLLDGEATELPDKGDTFVVAVPPGFSRPSLVVEADGYEQSISLEDGTEGEDNIALLRTPEDERTMTTDKRFRIAARTSIGLQGGAGPDSDLFYRDVAVTGASRKFFLGDDLTPSGPHRAFLLVSASYAYPDRPTTRYVFDPAEITFVGPQGARYPARDLDPAPDVALLAFDVPADLRKGTFVLGGTKDQISTTGVGYTMTLGTAEVPIVFGKDRKQ